MQMKQIVPLKPSNTCRVGANSIPPVLYRAKIMAASQVYRGNTGTIQDLVNFLVLGLSEEKQEVIDKLYDRGEELWNQMVAGKLTK